MEEELEEQEQDIWVKVCLHPLSNTEITKYLNYDPKFNGIFLKNDVKGTHWVLLFIDRNAVSSVFWLFRNSMYSTKSIKQNQR